MLEAGPGLLVCRRGLSCGGITRRRKRKKRRRNGLNGQLPSYLGPSGQCPVSHVPCPIIIESSLVWSTTSSEAGSSYLVGVPCRREAVRQAMPLWRARA